MPGIHLFAAAMKAVADGRDEPGHDERQALPGIWRALLEHDAEKRMPVFGKHRASTIS
jgi:hypothetical protein